MSIRVGGAVEVKPHTLERPVRIIDLDDTDSANIGRVRVKLGFNREQAHNAGRAFAGVLHDLVHSVPRDPRPTAGVLQDLAHSVPRDPKLAPVRESSASDLDLLPEQSQQSLFRLKELGATLRKSVSKELIDKLRLDSADPALMFAQEGRTPILWDMLYDSDKSEPFGSADWRRFWGFRRPVSHWFNVNRNPSGIDVGGGLFTAVSEDLVMARQETDWLHDYVTQRFRVRPQGLTVSLWECVRKFSKSKGSSLIEHLKSCSPHNPNGWASEAIADILRQSRERMQHFACHGLQCEHTQLRSRLVFLVSGDTQVGVNVANLADSESEIDEDADGRLVFINACSSGQPGVGYEPPGLPDLWIRQLGALAVVVTLCPVPDVFAAAFARKFYETLFGGTPIIAEAFLATRRYFMEHHNNPLGLAYMLYAKEGAHVTGAEGLP